MPRPVPKRESRARGEEAKRIRRPQAQAESGRRPVREKPGAGAGNVRRPKYAGSAGRRAGRRNVSPRFSSRGAGGKRRGAKDFPGSLLTSRVLFYALRRYRKPLAALVVVVFVAACALAVSRLTARSLVSLDNKRRAAAQQTKIFEPVACTPQMLDYRITYTGDAAGKPVTFRLDITNTGQRPCFTDVGYENVSLQVRSGSAEVWNSSACRIPEAKKMFLLDRRFTGRSSYTWPGTAAGEKCAGGSPVRPGTYLVRATVGGKTVVPDQPFELHPAGFRGGEGVSPGSQGGPQGSPQGGSQGGKSAPSGAGAGSSGKDMTADVPKK